MANISKLSTEPYKGVRDFYPEDMAVQNYIFNVWRKVSEGQGYLEYSASILEPAELYRSKGSDEIVNDQMYLFTDKGDREVALRPEMTPTLARMIAARRKGLKLPLKWFSIPNVFRYEKPQRGRKREHWQLNCDLMGIAGLDAEVELITLAYKIMKEFGAEDSDFEIRINDREALKNLDKNIMRLLDARSKMTEEEFQAKAVEISGKPFDLSTIEQSERVKELLSILPKNITAVFDRTLTRGFDYYTGIVFEVFDANPENHRSLFGGGRYDNLLELFGVEPLPTVGFGMGDVTMRDFLITHKLLPKHLKQD
jgi:histidyl-tRNA synthetase